MQPSPTVGGQGAAADGSRLFVVCGKASQVSMTMRCVLLS